MSDKMLDASLIPHEIAARAFRSAFQLLVGQGRKYSCAYDADVTGIKQRTVESYLSGQSSPGLSNYLTLCSVLGEAFMNETLKPTQFNVQSVEPGDTTPQKTLSKLLGTASVLSEALEDGHLDHQEKAEIKQRLGRLREQINALENSLDQPSLTTIPVEGVIS